MMIVIDANIILALMLPLAYSELATEKFNNWKTTEIELHAPLLLQYEVISVLRKTVVSGWITTEQAILSVGSIMDLGIEFAPPSMELHKRALLWAERLGQSKSYDAQYLALAEFIQANFWTADNRLVHAARQQAINWVHWIGEEPSTE
ncbi:MAG: type II toxin-antitoxin system VapC family toxin [Chloroflexota bacterium]|jgi:predicted nucleic acid-binding protein